MPPEDYETRRGEFFVAAPDLLLNQGEHKLVVGALDPVTRQASFVSLRRNVSRTNCPGMWKCPAIGIDVPKSEQDRRMMIRNQFERKT